ncbi:AAA family ATPase [Latilactobacillus curvatus]|uniref:AAA family ATPase n=1 Tax=Latilactobacillus curvatus TaxID=28038 RepID=UPI0013E29D37|nr:AAA family ATPase [Latilactobacillus curvatus]
MEITVAKREKMKIPILVTGVSGAGKTVSSLLIAKGIVEEMFPDLSDQEQWLKIAVIDTEHNRSKYYADSEIDGSKIGEFLHADFEPPYNAFELEKGVIELKQRGVEVIVLDSLTHLWSGDGGIQSQVDSINSKKRSGNNMTAWSDVKPEIDKLFSLITNSSVFFICTARSKTGYDMEKNDKGKIVPVKVGLKPEIRDGWEFEFAINFSINQDHIADVTKDNTNLFKSSAVINEFVGQQIYRWASEGLDIAALKNELIDKIEQLTPTTELRKAKFKGVFAAMRKAPLADWPLSYLKTMVDQLSSLPDHDSEPAELPNIDEAAETVGNAFA